MTQATRQTLNDHGKLSIKDYKEQLKEKPGAELVTVDYQMSNGDKGRQEITVTTTPCTYGGKRYWWACPQCERRAAVLYFKGGYRCRHCTGLPYKTQNKRPLDRALLRVEVIRKALGWKPGIANGHGPKPRGMWLSTFKTLVYEHDRLANQIINEIKGGL